MTTTDVGAGTHVPSGGGAPVEVPLGTPTNETEGITRGRLVLRRFLRNRLALVGLLTLVLLYALSLLSPLFAPWAYNEYDYTAFLQPPSPSHWFGTSQIGEDVFAQTMRGLQKSLTIGLLTGLISIIIASLVGASAGYFGGWVDRGLMWVVDLLLVLPSFLIIAVISPALRGSSWILFVLLLGVFAWMITARILRGMTMTLREREFVKAAKFMGAPSSLIIRRHILPNMASLMIIDVTITVGATILLETGLSYFGFGVQPPDVSLGTLIRDGSNAAVTTPWLFLFAGGLLVISVLAVNFVGDGLRDALDPNSRGGRRRSKSGRKTKKVPTS
ncbi:ABC transporter permease [Pseudonocardia aurantiaca]|uniref:Oligopeptide transport system permease protein OppC n=1 Tax=Pseudonocardia aurantiaca TaxID=75290 RepID=A0ABW4FSQ4_9PSEU